jgi:hypothetical protein
MTEDCVAAMNGGQTSVSVLAHVENRGLRRSYEKRADNRNASSSNAAAVTSAPAPGP